MEKQIIGRGLLAGALAGVLAFVFARIFVEPVIERAIDFEDGIGAAHEAMERPRARRAMSTAPSCSPAESSPTSAWASACWLSASRWARCSRSCSRWPTAGSATSRPRLLSVLVAGGMLISLWIVPALKYPANPPAISHDETITPAHAAVPADGRAVGGAARRRGLSRSAAGRRSSAPGTRRWSAAARTWSRSPS